MREVRQALPYESGAVLAFYEEMIDQMWDLTEKPGWQKGVYPTAGYLDAAIARGELYLLTEDGAILGAVILNHHCGDAYGQVAWQVEAAPEQVMVIHTFGVLPSHQKRGLARYFVEECARIARAAGCRAMRLDVLSSNRPAQAFYLKVGFVHLDTLKLYYEDTGLADFLMYERVL